MPVPGIMTPGGQTVKVAVRLATCRLHDRPGRLGPRRGQGRWTGRIGKTPMIVGLTGSRRSS